VLLFEIFLSLSFFLFLIFLQFNYLEGAWLLVTSK
jgi:hypothetical protein